MSSTSRDEATPIYDQTVAATGIDPTTAPVVARPRPVLRRRK